MSKDEKQHTKRPEEIIEEWTVRDLTAAANAGDLPPAFEIDDTLQQLSDMIAAGKHPIVAGPSGVGRTAAIFEFVRLAAGGERTPGLEGKRVLQFSLRHKLAGLSSIHDLRPSMRQLVDALVAAGDDIVPWFSDLDAAYSGDLEPLLHALALRFSNPILGEGDLDQMRTMLECSEFLAEAFVILPIEEPSFDKTRRILEKWSEARGARGRGDFLPEAIDEALRLSHRFLARSRQPRKAIDLLEQAWSAHTPGSPVTARTVIARFCRSQRVPRGLIDPDVALDIDEMEGRFARQVLGQPEGVRAVVRVVCLIKAGLSDSRRPFAALLFVGPAGVGKTQLARALAEYLFGSPDRLLRLNMADYQGAEDADVLFGSAESASQLRRRGVLSHRISGQPFGVLLLDEFEKAHPVVHDRFLQLLDEGTFINGAGELVSCRSMIIIATSNAGADAYRRHVMGFGARPQDRPGLRREVDRALAETFRFELLNRFDQIVHFFPLTREDIRTIASRELEKIQQRTGFKHRGYLLEVDDTVLDWITAHGYDPEHGARFLVRIVERHVTTALAEAMVRAAAPSGACFHITVRRNRVAARLASRSRSGRDRELVVLPVGAAEKARALDKPHLLAEADGVLKNAARRLEDLESLKEEAARLLERINEEDLWSGMGKAREVIERYRELDVAIQAGERLAGPIRDLEAARAEVQNVGAPLQPLARALEDAARSLRQWEERLAEEGAGTVWVLLTKVDPLLPATKWLTDLTGMELAWCSKLGLHARAVACQNVDGELSRIVLEVEGPGAGAVLAMEHGVHRLVRNQASDLRVRIEVIATSTGGVAPWPRIRRIKKNKGPFDLALAFAARIEIPGRGMVLEFLGQDQETLGHIVGDLRGYLEHSQGATETARVYGIEGSGARDPRTGAAVARLRDVLRGDLDGLLEAWRRSLATSR